MADYPLFNGKYPSWASLSLSFDGFDTSDFTKLDWEDKLEPGKVRGKGSFARGRTQGDYDCDGSFSMLLDAATKFMRQLATKNPSIGLVPFDVVGQWSDTDGGDVHEVRLVGCRIQGRKSSSAPGTDAAAIEFPLSIMGISVDGIWLLEPPSN